MGKDERKAAGRAKIEPYLPIPVEEFCAERIDDPFADDESPEVVAGNDALATASETAAAPGVTTPAAAKATAETATIAVKELGDVELMVYPAPGNQLPVAAATLAQSVLAVLPDRVPPELRRKPHWVLWRLERKTAGDKPTKIPYQTNGRHAKADDPSTWITFERAVSVYGASRKNAGAGLIPYSGIGYEFAKDDGLVGIDLDNCRNAESGELKPWAAKIVKRFDTYTEVSPSGTGVKLWCRGRLSIDRTGRRIEYGGGAIEMYQHGRYFAVTGHKLDDAPGMIAEAQAAIDWLWNKVFAKPTGAKSERNDRPNKSRVQDRSRVLERARKYLANLPLAVSGKRGHDATFHAACVLVLGFDLSPDEAYPLMVEYSQRCKPPWSEKEIQHKLDDANKQPGERGRLLDVRQTPKENQATSLVELASEWELWHTAAGECYATIPAGTHREHWPIQSRVFKRWLAKAYYDATGKAAGSEAVATALNLIEARAAHDGDERPVFVRVAEHRGAIYLDLCDPSWQVVEISAAGWRVVDEPPVRFRRSKAMLPLPRPERGATVDELRQFVNVEDADWVLVVAWLVAAMRPRGPYPVLALFATQGAGKSNTARFLRGLVDPNAAPLRSEPRDARDLMISASGNWCIAYDNLSHLPAWLSDALCRLSTGGGFATRELYSDADEVIFDAMRPVILTSIVELAERSDLLDRCLPVSLPPIGDDRRRDEETLTAEFERAQPRILGALLDAAAGALRDLPGVALCRLPRMADFAKWATAAEAALGWPPGTFIAAYTRNRDAANELALEASPIAGRLLELLAQGQWEGKAGELLNALDESYGGETKRPPGWPKNPRSLSSHLRRLAPNLQAAGWSVDFGRQAGGGRARIVVIKRAAERAPGTCVPTVPSVPPRGENAANSDNGRDGRNANRDGRGTVEAVATSLGDGRDGRDANIRAHLGNGSAGRERGEL